MKVKICGLTNLEDAVRACEYGADLLGFVFVKGTPRYVKDVTEIISNLPPKFSRTTGRVGLFMDEDPDKAAEKITENKLDYVQLHGDETPEYCRVLGGILREKYNASVSVIKTFKVAEDILPHGKYGPGDYESVDYFVFDTFHPEVSGGTGISFNWRALAKERDRIRKPFFIAGGLTPQNVAEAIGKVCPYGVDVSSGVESVPGRKDKTLLKEFIHNAKNT